MELLDEEDVRGDLRRACEAAGSQKAWASRHGVSHTYVGDVLQGRRDPGRAILDALGCERVVGYRKKRPAGPRQASG